MRNLPMCGLLYFLVAGLLGGFERVSAQDGWLLVPRGSSWKYLDTGTNLVGTSWRSIGYDDSGWLSGNAPLGYGETNLGTIVSYGPDPDNKYITTYFRKTFNVPDASQIHRLFLNVLRDDGVIVYLNGTEVFRNNLPLGPISFRTLASTNVYGAGERTYYTSNFVFSLLSGDNLLAVELHQAGADSIDLNFDLEMTGSDVTITRGPYLQIGTPTNIIVRWRTDVPSISRVQYGTNLAVLDFMIEDDALTTEHELQLTGLDPDTKYYYSAGTSDRAVGGPDYFFITAPTTNRPTRIWVTGDTRTGDSYQAAVRNAYYEYAGSNYTHLWLLLGDNGGPTGTDAEFGSILFDFFPEMFRQTVAWPTIGNHETYCCWPPPHLEIFSLPTAGEAGGYPSGSELYFSFNYANIHFVVLDSVLSDLSVGGAMYNWLQADLDANRSDWLIGYFHYPPYSKGSHDSDFEWGLIEVRENFLPLLEAYGVDLVMSGHSHNYERSFLLDSFYGFSWDMQPENIIDSGSGRADDSGPYVKSPGLNPHEGAVYVVAGSSGLLSPGPLGHPAMFYAANNRGSLILDVNGNTLAAKFLRDTGAIDDHFTIIKGTPPERIRISQIVAGAGTVTLVWHTVPGRSYQVLRRDSLGPGSDWAPISASLPADDTALSWTDNAPPSSSAFYRIVETSP